MHGPVLLLDQDTPSNKLRLNLRSLGGASARLHAISHKGFRLDKADDAARLLRVVKELKPVLIVVDSMVSCSTPGLDEDKAKEVAPFFSNLRKIMAEHPCTILVVHHSPKGARGMPHDLVRGSGHIVNSSDVIYGAYRMPGEGRFVVRTEGKRVLIEDPGFAAEVVDEADQRRIVWLQRVTSGDPEHEQLVAELLDFIDEAGTAGRSFDDARKHFVDYIGRDRLRDLLRDLSLEGRLVQGRGPVRGGPHVFWTPGHVPERRT